MVIFICFFQSLQSTFSHKMVARKIKELQNIHIIFNGFQYQCKTDLKHVFESFQKLENDIMFYDDQIRPSLLVENQIYEDLETLGEWLETTEDVVTSVRRAESCELFEEALVCLQVGISFCLNFFSKSC